jgi:hypothetical protein
MPQDSGALAILPGSTADFRGMKQSIIVKGQGHSFRRIFQYNSLAQYNVARDFLPSKTTFAKYTF